MTSATQGRRPDGPGYHWRYDEPCLVYQEQDEWYVKFIDDTRAYRLDDIAA